MSERKKVRLTMLNFMAGEDFVEALDRTVSWGVKDLDLKDSMFGRGILDLSDEQLVQVSDLVAERDLSVYCLSTTLFFDPIEKGRSFFETNHLARVSRAIEAAQALRPRFIRLIGARMDARGEVEDSTSYILREHPWLIPMYREAVDRICEAGFVPTIENEILDCIWSCPNEIVSFFEQLDRPNKVSFTWDVQNLWEAGTFPTLEVYETLKPLIGYYHLKGGQCEEAGGKLKWASSLEDASWDVVGITSRAVADGLSEVICLNPSHGERKDGYDYEAVIKRDLDFLRREIQEIE